MTSTRKLPRFTTLSDGNHEIWVPGHWWLEDLTAYEGTTWHLVKYGDERALCDCLIAPISDHPVERDYLHRHDFGAICVECLLAPGMEPDHE